MPSRGACAATAEARSKDELGLGRDGGSSDADSACAGLTAGLAAEGAAGAEELATTLIAEELRVRGDMLLNILSTTSTLSRFWGRGRDADWARCKNTVTLFGSNASFHFRSERYSFHGRDYAVVSLRGRIGLGSSGILSR